jgi:hypothetical protein
VGSLARTQREAEEPPNSKEEGLDPVFGGVPSGGGLVADAAVHFGTNVATGGDASGGAGVDLSGSTTRPVVFGAVGGLLKRPDGVSEEMKGLYAGIGVGLYLTNARPGQLAGKFDVVNLNVGLPFPFPGAPIPPFSVQLASGGKGVWFGSVTYGPGFGLSVSRYTTTGIETK